MLIQPINLLDVCYRLYSICDVVRLLEQRPSAYTQAGESLKDRTLLQLDLDIQLDSNITCTSATSC